MAGKITIHKFKGNDKGIQAILSSSETKRALRAIGRTSGVWDTLQGEFRERGIETREEVRRTKSRIKVGISSDDPRYGYVGARSRSLRNNVLARIKASSN